MVGNEQLDTNTRGDGGENGSEEDDAKEDTEMTLRRWGKRMKEMEGRIERLETKMLETLLEVMEQQSGGTRPTSQPARTEPAPQLRRIALEDAPRPAPQPEALSEPQSLVTEAACDWHRNTPGSAVEAEDAGVEEKDVDNWLTHLSATLFVRHGKLWSAIGSNIRPVWNKCTVTACRTQANRFFHVQCNKCRQSVYGEYGIDASDQSPEAHDRTMNALAQFLHVQRPSYEKEET